MGEYMPPKWERRLFHQRIDGFTDVNASDVTGGVDDESSPLLTDHHRATTLIEATVGQELYREAHAYLLKVVKHFSTGAHQKLDAEALDHLDEVLTVTADDLMRTTEKLKEYLTERGYSGAGPSW